MAEFQFDTSGEVRVYTNAGEPDGARKRDYRWRDLSPFMQGYVEAVLISADAAIWLRINGAQEFAFSDLAPETLARIMEECARRVATYPDPDAASEDGQLGADFYENRQLGHRTGEGFPPLTPYVGDDGKVYLREGVAQ